MKEFKRGDQVTLKSGGPIMTVCEVSYVPISGKTETIITCKWFGEGNKIEQHDFYGEELDINN